ncbi:MAG: Spy/CpxP family protein refolding chaperone [Bryobacteraceae bacterium]
MQKQILTAAALLALTALLAIAQPTPPTPAEMVADQVARLTKLLDLSSAQQASATTIFTTEQTALATLRTSLHTARTALQTAIKSNDTGTIGTEAAQIGTLTGQQVLAQATASGAFYAILTADQQSKYDTFGPLSGGPGGRGGPGPRGVGGSH